MQKWTICIVNGKGKDVEIIIGNDFVYFDWGSGKLIVDKLVLEKLLSDKG